jgi:integrase
MITITEAVERHLIGKKPATKQVYRRAAKLFDAYCFEHGIQWHSARYHEIAGYLEYLKERPGIIADNGHSTLGNRTIRRNLVIIAALYRANRLDFSVFDHAFRAVPVSLKPQKRITGYVPFDQVMRLFEATSKDLAGARNRAYMALCFGGALRTNEALNLKMADIKRTERGTLYVHLNDTKTNRAAQQIIIPSLVPYVEAYRDLRRKDGALNEDPFLSGYTPNGQACSNRPIKAGRMLDIFYALTKEVLGKELGTHSMRATAITKLLADGVPHRQVQDFSRHATVSMVELYDKMLYQIDDSPAKKMSYQ